MTLTPSSFGPLVRVGLAVFIAKGGQFLIGQRQNSHGPGTWSIPGGHIEFGESFVDTAKREVKEETGLVVKNVRFGGITNDFFEVENKHYITVWMIADYTTGREIIAEPDKLVDLKWVSFDNLPQPLFLPWQQLLSSEFIEKIKADIAQS